MPPTVTQLAQRVDKLERALKRLEERQVDPDALLFPVDRQAIRAADADARAGRLISHAALKKKYHL